MTHEHLHPDCPTRTPPFGWYVLPLYVDGILSEETQQAVKAHLEMCESCQKDYESMAKKLVLPSAPKVQEENGKVL